MRSRRDRGSVSLWLVIFGFTVLVLLGFVVDGGQYMNAHEQAADIALQAARAAVDDLNIGNLRNVNEQVSVASTACQPNGPAATLVSEYAGNGATIGDCTPGWLNNGACKPSQPPGLAMPCVRVKVEVKMSPVIPIGPFGTTVTATATEWATLDCGSQAAPEAC